MSSELRIKDSTKVKFERAASFRKTATLPVANVRIAEGGESVITQHIFDGTIHTETPNTAEKGDYIITRSAKDSYIVPAKKFLQLYEIDPENPDIYRSRNFGRAFHSKKDFVISTSWGEDQHIKAGGVIFQGFCNEVYGNQGYSFEADFAREAADGSLIPLTAPLEEQLKWALEKGESLHILDIKRRMRYQERLASTAQAMPNAYALAS